MNIALRFVSSNPYKIGEAKTILAAVGVDVIPSRLKIEELQTNDAESLVRDKALKAFRAVGRPLFVEHTGLYLAHLNGFPGGLTQLFWDKLHADRFTELLGNTADTAVVARTVVGYVDGRRCHQFKGEIEGIIATEPRGNREFQWDCVFVPKGYDETFAELGEKKNEISMRRKALDQFADFLRGGSS